MKAVTRVPHEAKFDDEVGAGQFTVSRHLSVVVAMKIMSPIQVKVALAIAVQQKNWMSLNKHLSVSAVE